MKIGFLELNEITHSSFALSMKLFVFDLCCVPNSNFSALTLQHFGGNTVLFKLSSAREYSCE